MPDIEFIRAEIAPCEIRLNTRGSSSAGNAGGLALPHHPSSPSTNLLMQQRSTTKFFLN